MSQHGFRKTGYQNALLLLLFSVNATRQADTDSLWQKVIASRSTTAIATTTISSIGDQCHGSLSQSQMKDAMMYFIDELNPTELRIAFQSSPDDCLLDALWTKGIPAQVMIGHHLENTLKTSTYLQKQQYVIMGSLSWVISAMKIAADGYIMGSINAFRTKWLWVVNELPNEDFDSVISEMKDVLIEGILGILIHAHQTVDGSIRIGSVEDPGDGTWLLQPAGKWTTDGGLSIYKSLWPSRPKNFKGRNVNVSVVKKPTVFYYTGKQSISEAEGYCSDLLEEIQKNLNFSKTMLLTKGFGSPLSNGSWNGMVGALTRREADVATIDFTPTYARAQVIDFGIIYGTDNVIVVSKAPSVHIKPFILLQIFTPFVWGCFAGIGLISGGVISGILKLGGQFGNRDEMKKESDIMGNLLLYCAMSLKILVYQSSSKWPKKSGARLVSAFMMVLALLFGSLYSGSITAFLAIPFRSEPINSLEDLITTNIQPAIMEATSNYNYFAVQTKGVLAEVKNRMVALPAAYILTWPFFSEIAEGKYAYIDTTSATLGAAGSYERVDRPCLFHVGRKPVRLDLDAFSFRKNSPFIQQFNNIMRWLRSYGIMEHMKGRYYSLNCIPVVASDKPMALNVNQAQGAFYVFAVGLGISLGAFSLEILFNTICAVPFLEKNY